MISRSFGKLSDGRTAGLYILHNRNGMEAHLTDYGAALVSLIVPDRNGKKRDVVQGYDDAAGYEKGGSSMGAIVGRVANRISNAAFDLNGRHYILTANNGPNTLHGGRDFYVHRLWSAVIPFGKISTGDITAAYAVESMNDWSSVPRGRSLGETHGVSEQDPGTQQNKNLSRYTTEMGWTRETFDQYAAQAAGTAAGSDSVTFTLDSPDGDQGFPGSIHIEVTYTLTDSDELHIDYKANLTDSLKSAAPGGERFATPLNLTNHSYFNLNGHSSGSVLAQEVWIGAEKFTEADRRSVPTGTLLDVKWTPMDFRRPKPLGQDIGKDYEPLKYGNGYDHNFVLSDGMTEYRSVAGMYSPESGIGMTVLTDLPGIQLYTANGLDNEPGKGGAVYGFRSSACFETQFWPDTINKANFPGGLLREGETFTSRTTYKFETVSEE